MFNALYRLGNCVEISGQVEQIYACAAKGENEAAILISNFAEDDAAPAVQLKIAVEGFSEDTGILAEYYLLDEDHDMELVREEVFTGVKYAPILPLPLHSIYLIKLTKVEAE